MARSLAEALRGARAIVPEVDTAEAAADSRRCAARRPCHRGMRRQRWMPPRTCRPPASRLRRQRAARLDQYRPRGALPGRGHRISIDRPCHMPTARSMRCWPNTCWSISRSPRKRWCGARWRGCCGPAARLTLEVPDFEWVCATFLAANDDWREFYVVGRRIITPAAAARWISAGASCRRCSSAIRMAPASSTAAATPRASCARSPTALGVPVASR